MFTANGWTVDRIKSNKGAVVNAQDAELVGRSISDEGYGIVVVQQDYNGAELTFSDCTMLTTVEDGKPARGRAVLSSARTATKSPSAEVISKAVT